ncbi:transcriptional regulator [Ureibacillus sp. Re31]|uniref:Transcriptional regulator n=1 Tax=Ureibacillus galli TaxID=2762222 RepID=A0ABR8XFE0_9BACL|nr:transcriptional regulator [Ureibacillus galli]MBD8027937.1 transcriptional regulator [Ureibacillus galli]
MTNNVTTQYNGMILLTGYLQRLFVAETIYRRVGEPFEQERYDKVKALLDEAYTILPVFEETHTLTAAQKIQLQLIAQQTEELMKTYFKQMPLSFNQKLAIVGSSLYAEQHVNAGIIRLGKMFNVEVNKDFHQRTKFYEERTKMIDYLVFVLHHEQEPEEQIKKPIDPWFNDVMKNNDFVLEDFKQIAEMLEFN